MRILVVEDEQDLNRILAKTLTAEGYSVDACFDGVEALDYLEGAEYDAIVLDVMMPRMDGITMMMKVRRAAFQNELQRGAERPRHRPRAPAGSNLSVARVRILSGAFSIKTKRCPDRSFFRRANPYYRSVKTSFLN